MRNQFDMFSGVAGAPKPEQFKLTQLQIFNWGTFSDLFTIDVAQRGFLFVGPSGAGKSTILDAHAALMTPPKWVGFNLAAREGESGGHGSDRNLMTYVRGAWAQQTGTSGEAVQQYLRANTTWSALAETYTTGSRTVTIAQVFWVRGKSTDRKEIKRSYLVIERGFDVRELQPFADRDFDMKLIRALDGVHVHDEFSGYGERLRRLLGMEQESSMRLLHKTQSAKNLGDINDFLRDFTLEPPQTFDLAKQLVEHFQALREAHATVVDTRRQIEVLEPARQAYDLLLSSRSTLAHLAETRANLDAYKEQLRAKLLSAQISQTAADIATQAEQSGHWREQESESKAKLSILTGKRHGNAIAHVGRCEAELVVANNLLASVVRNQVVLDGACEVLGVGRPSDECSYGATYAAAESYLATLQEKEAARQTQRDDINFELRANRKQQETLQYELAGLARRRSNIPGHLLDTRTKLCAELGIDESTLPFAGELVDVTESETAWKGAAERLMRGFAEHIVAPKEVFQKVKAAINKRHIGTLVTVYDAGSVQPVRACAAQSMASKLTFMEHDLVGWVRQKAIVLFDHVCVSDVGAMDGHRRAVTIEGLVKADESSFRKDDRYRVDDRSKWILGGDTRAKIHTLQDSLAVLVSQHSTLEQSLQALGSPRDVAEQMRKCERLLDLSWAQLDLVDAQHKQAVAADQLETAKADAPDLAVLDAQIAEEEAKHTAAQKQASRLEAQNQTLGHLIVALQAKLEKLNSALLSVELSESMLASLADRLAAASPVALELDNVDAVVGLAKDAIAAEERTAQNKAASVLHQMTAQFREYIRTWPAKAAGLDAVEASAADFFEILSQLELDGLPQYEAKFLTLLQEQGTQEMMRLQRRIEEERRDIRIRMDAVNDSLKKTAFNAGTYLVIEPKEKSIPDVLKFRQDLREAYGNYMQDTSTAEIERRFGVLNEIVRKLENQDSASKAWRDLCLDVRRHVEFVIREFNTSGDEVEVYRSGAGKSGGQRQKLTATILAAALRYQLGGKETGIPTFSTVFMDEAFDKADAEFTDLAMKVFETFGFQLVVATPLKSVMTLEPYIGGACFVHIEDRKHSRVVPVMYLEGEKKLDFKKAGLNFEADDDI